MEMSIDVQNIRNIKTAQITLPLDRGLYSLVGENGCGKSTLMLIMSLIVKTSSAHMLTSVDIGEDSHIDIPSVEKYLKRKCIDDPDRSFIKLIGDKYFSLRSLPNIIDDYNNDERTQKTKDSDGKNFYKIVCSNLEKMGISESDFIKYISDDIYDYEKPVRFVESLKKLLT